MTGSPDVGIGEPILRQRRYTCMFMSFTAVRQRPERFFGGVIG